MSNKDIAKAFINHNTATTNDFGSSGDKLFSYTTCIAQWYNGKVIVNNTKYSHTTACQLNLILKLLEPEEIINTTKEVPKESKDLREYV
jgi:hypothetical protein